MKDQYFGDINDYLKYGILRGLVGAELRLMVAWMLTGPDGRSDGKFTSYLREPERWRRLDPQLFDYLERAVRSDRRSVSLIEGWEGLDATFFSHRVPDDRPGRRGWSEALQAASRGHDLVFFDPDNGLEVASCPVGRKNSGKYVRRVELEAAWHAGSSLLVYQHFRRVKRDRFLQDMAAEFTTRLASSHVSVCRTPRVAFFLVSQPRHAAELPRRASNVADRWHPHVAFSVPRAAQRRDPRRPGA